MTIGNKRITAIALGLALSVLASPSFAQRGENQNHMSAAREQALRECNLAAQKYTQHTWADVQIYTYRACMAQHGQQE